MFLQLNMDLDVESCGNCRKVYLKKSGGLRKHELMYPNGECRSTKKRILDSEGNVVPKKGRGHSVEGKSADETAKPRPRSKSMAPSIKSKSTEFMFGSIDPGMAAIVKVAVNGLLEQHERYSMTELDQYVRENYPDVPKELVEHMILAASSAAWYVASKFYLRERLIHSAQEHHQVQVEKISRSMLSWFTGFRKTKADDSTKTVTTETMPTAVKLAPTVVESDSRESDELRLNVFDTATAIRISGDKDSFEELTFSTEDDHLLTDDANGSLIPVSMLNGLAGVATAQFPSTNDLVTVSMLKDSADTDQFIVASCVTASNNDISGSSAMTSVMYNSTDIAIVPSIDDPDAISTLKEAAVSDPKMAMSNEFALTDDTIDSSAISILQDPDMIDLSKHNVSTVPVVTTSPVVLSNTFKNSVVNEFFTYPMSMPVVSSDVSFKINNNVLYDPSSVMCTAGYDPEDPSMNGKTGQLFATNPDLTAGAEKLFGNIVKFDLPVSMSQSAYGKMTEEICQRVAINNFLPQLKKRKFDDNANKPRVTDSTTKKLLESSEKITRHVEKQNILSTVTMSKAESSDEKKIISLLSSDDEVVNPKTSVHATSTGKENKSMFKKSKLISSEVKVHLVDIGNKLNKSKPIQIVDDVMSDVEPDSDEEFSFADKVSKLVVKTQFGKELMKPTNESQLTDKDSKSTMKPQPVDKLSKHTNELQPVARTSRPTDKTQPIEKLSKSVEKSQSGEKSSKSTGNSQTVNKFLDSAKVLKSVDKASKPTDKSQTIEKPPKSVEKSQSGDKSSKSTDNSQTVGRLLESVQLLQPVDKSNVTPNTTVETEHLDDTSPNAGDLYEKQTELDETELTSTATRFQLKETDKEVTSSYVTNKDEVLQEVLKELAYLRSRSENILSPMSTSSSLSLVTPSQSLTSLPTSKNDSGVEITDKELMDNPKLDELLRVTDHDEYFKGDTQMVRPKVHRASEDKEYSRTGYARDDYRKHPSYDDRTRSRSPFIKPHPYRGNSRYNSRGQSYRGWSRPGYDRQYAQPDRRTYSYKNESQEYYTRQPVHIPRLCDQPCQLTRRQDQVTQSGASSARTGDNRNEPSARKPDEPKRVDMLDLSSLNPELLDKIHELIRLQK